LEFARDLPSGAGFALGIRPHRVAEIVPRGTIGLAVQARASRGSAARIVPRREIVPRGTIAASVTGVDGDLLRISAFSGLVLGLFGIGIGVDALRSAAEIENHKPAQSSAKSVWITQI
jgi:hypothetical protein